MNKSIYSKQSKKMIAAMKDLRVRAGLTQRDLSVKLKKAQSFVAKCELGERRVDLVEWYWLCEACGADVQKETKKLLAAFVKA